MTRVHKISVELTTSQLLALAELLTTEFFTPEFIARSVWRLDAVDAVDASTRLMAAVNQEVSKK